MQEDDLRRQQQGAVLRTVGQPGCGGNEKGAVSDRLRPNNWGESEIGWKTPISKAEIGHENLA